MASDRDIVVTGLGVVSPIGIGKDVFWRSLLDGRSGIQRLHLFDDDELPQPFGGVVSDFDPKQYVRPRKSLKVMSRDIQLGFAAADIACVDAGLRDKPCDPDRLGVLLGADIIPCELDELVGAYRNCIVDGKFSFDRWGQAFAAELFPLWMLKYLPNMPACHIGIAQDARGPNNTITLGDVSTLSAISEAARVLERGQADTIIAGGVSSRVSSGLWARNQAIGQSKRYDKPEAASRPFDAQRDGLVNGEGAAALILEKRGFAEKNQRKPLAWLRGFASAFEPPQKDRTLRGDAIRRVILGALKMANLQPQDIGFVVAHGLSSVEGDRIEAQAIRDTLGEVPVTAPKSFFGYLGAAAGALETILAVLALQNNTIPHTLNYETPDPECPINVVHGQPAPLERPATVIISYAPYGQAAALVFSRAD